MSFEPATTQQFSSNYRFEEFVRSGTNVDSIEQALAEGLYNVGQNWNNEHDYQLGQMLYAAHQLTLAGLGDTVEAELARDGLLGFDSITSGKLSVSRRGASGGSSGGTKDPLATTKYGKEYLRIRFRNLAGPRVVLP